MSFLLDEDKTWVQRDFGLDRRLVKALSKLGFIYPTLVQAKTLPIAMQGKDMLVRARTGSGKTIAFSLPVLQKVLGQLQTARSSGSSLPFTKCVVLAPTKELVKQIEKHMTDLIYYCREEITLCCLGDDSSSTHQYKLQARPDIVIATPTKLVALIKAGHADLSQVSSLVIDEADLVLSFGYTEQVRVITASMPKIFQGILVSATLSAELDKFKKVILHNPAILKLEEPKGMGNLLQFYLEANESDKYLIMYVFIKLGLLQGKGLIFVNDINKCYKLKLFFQQFFVSAAVLNAEVPLNSRVHIIEEYNRGVFDYLIATDSVLDDGEDEDNDEEEDEERNEGEEEDSTSGNKKNKKKAKKISSSNSGGKKKGTDGDYGVSRGIDFQGVNFVINFDFPTTPAAYTHRVGRTARGMASGTSLSFVMKNEVGCAAADRALAEEQHATLFEVQQQQPRLGVVEGDNVLAAVGAAGDAAHNQMHQMQPSLLQFNMAELDSFRYRVTDTLRGVTVAAVRELRSAEIKREVLNSDKLKSYFAENPNDLKVLRHDKAILHPLRIKDHLRHVPDYLVPASMKGAVASGSGSSSASNRSKKRKMAPGAGAQRVAKSKSSDPLNAAAASGDAEGGDGGHDEFDSSIADNRMFSSTSGLGNKHNSGRQQWKMKHGKGDFNERHKKHNSHQQKGAFQKTTQYK